ncbi:MAG TPA: hydroxyquinol 1,2-dioxygenase [Sphingobium sp.]
MTGTRFGSINDYSKGRVEIIDDDPRNYVFSNLFETAAQSAPYDRIAIGKNFEYVIEVARAEGASPWFACAHDEFVLVMDGHVELHLVKLANPDQAIDPDSRGAHRLADQMPDGRKMGRIVLGRGHMALLPTGSAYRFQAQEPGAIIFQTIEGPLTIEKWADICQVEAA